MASKYDALAKTIINNVGGKDNIKRVTHCVTRLRFYLKDESKANDDIISSLDEVIQVMHSAGQYQVVVGPIVGDVYDTVLAVGHLTGGGEVDAETGEPIDGVEETAAPKGIMNIIMDLIAGILQPILGPLAAAGMTKGFLALFAFLGWMSSTDGVYMIINSFADGFFYFLPVILGFTSAKKFGANPFIGMAMGAALTYPTMVNSSSLDVLGTVLTGTPFEMSYHITFLGIPVIFPSSGYTSSVVPIILSMFVVAKIEQFFKKSLPASVNFFLTPMLTCIIGVILTYLVIGPIAATLTNILLMFFNFIFDLPVVGATLGGVLVGGFWQVLVIFGLHWAVVPINLANLAANGFDTVLAGKVACEMAQIACVLAIYLKSKDLKVKNIALPAIITGFFGTTEPAIYGVTLPRMKPFVYSCIAGAISGGFACFMQAKIFVAGYSGIMALARYIDPTPGGYGISCAISAGIAMLIGAGVGFLLTWFFWDEKAWAEKNTKK